jgi:hypothetical protein
MIDAPGLALLVQNISLWSIPGNVRKSELCVTLLLKYLRCSFEALHKLNLSITF